MTSKEKQSVLHKQYVLYMLCL